MTFGTLYGNVSESNGLYGIGQAIPGSTYFEWFIFKESVGQPATPTGGSWNFDTNIGIPPTGWSSTSPNIPVNPVWFCIAFVDSRNPTVIVWSTASKITAGSAAAAVDISFAPTGTLTSTNVQSAIAEVLTDYSAQTGAASIGFTPVGAIVATNVQAAIAEVVTDLAASNGSASVGYLQTGTGAVATTVQAKLRQTRNVIDFGAVGDGSTDNTTAIQNAMTAAGSGTLLFPDGVFNISGVLTVPIGLKIQGTYRLGQNGNAAGNNGGSKIVQTGTGTTVAATTGTVSGDVTGNYILTVANATGMAVGGVITIAGAGAKGTTLYSKIAAIAGLTVTLNSLWTTPVTGAVVTVKTGVNIFELHNTGYDNSGSTVDILGNSFDGLWLSGGYDQISAKNGGVWVTTRNMTFSNPARSGVYFAGFVQQWFSRDVEMTGGPYGFLYGGAGISLAQQLFDKNRFENTYLNGQNINGADIMLLSGTGQASNWINLTMNNCAQEGLVLGGGFSDCHFFGVNTETNGYTGSAPTPPTTGSITAASTSLVVASATGLAIGQTLTVQGAGSLGDDLVTQIDNLVGTTATLRLAASFTVSSAEVVNYPFSDIAFKYNATGIAPRDCNFYGGSIGIGGSVGEVRYAIDARQKAHTFSGITGSRPITANGSIIGDCQIPFRQILNAYSAFSINNFPTSTASQSQFVSPPGTNLVLALQAANAGTATGFGQWQGYRADPNRTKIWGIDGTSGTASFTGGVSPGAGYVGAFSSGIIFYASGSPQTTSPWSTLPWVLGSKAFNSSPAVGQPKGWVCTVAGTPGTWVSEGNL
jgi:hypothetical protein